MKIERDGELSRGQDDRLQVEHVNAMRARMAQNLEADLQTAK